VEVHEARVLLGVDPSQGWDAVRLAYRRLIRELHPDHAGPATTHRAAQLNEAYAVLARAARETTASAARAGAPSPAPPPPPPPPPPRPRPEVHIDGGDTIVVHAPPDEAFTRLLEAGHAVGSVSYVDRSGPIFEVVVRYQGETCSLLVTLQGRNDHTEAICTVESMVRAFQPPAAPIVRQLAAALDTPWVSPPHN
jgi:DnaJ-like protein